MNWQTQIATWTSYNRYPGVFRTLQAHIQQTCGPNLNQGRLKILSFGCSSGHELLSLRSYFPEASLFGCDVNAGALREASASLLMDEAVLFESTPENIAAQGPFDIILAMSVLCRFPESMGKGVASLSAIYSFDSFERIAGLLSENLVPGGLLTLVNTNYNFMRTEVSAGFTEVGSPLLATNGFVDKFAASGRRFSRCEQVGPYYVHAVHSADHEGEAVDFTSCIFGKFQKSIQDATITFGTPVDLGSLGEPIFFKFGPDLQECRRRKLVATALGYWLLPGTEPTVAKAWHRTTPEGEIVRLAAWTSLAGPSTSTALAAPHGHHLAHLPPESAWVKRARKAKWFGTRVAARLARP